MQKNQKHRAPLVIDCGDFFFSVFLTRLKFTALLVHAQPWVNDVCEVRTNLKYFPDNKIESYFCYQGKIMNIFGFFHFVMWAFSLPLISQSEKHPVCLGPSYCRISNFIQVTLTQPMLLVMVYLTGGLCFNFNLVGY